MMGTRETVINGLLQLLSEFLFEDSKLYRFTILQPDDTSTILIPRFRYTPGQRGSFSSNARLSKQTSLAALAWHNPDTPFAKRYIPEFNTNQEFVKFFQDEFAMPKAEVMMLSPFMRKVRSIFCYGLVSSEGEFLGTLSIDALIPDAFSRLRVERLIKFRHAIAGVLELETAIGGL